MVRPEVAAARVARAQAWLTDAESYAMLDYRRVREESREGIRPLRVFLEAVATAAGL